MVFVSYFSRWCRLSFFLMKIIFSTTKQHSCNFLSSKTFLHLTVLFEFSLGHLTLSLSISNFLFPVVKIPLYWIADETLAAIYLHDILYLNEMDSVWEKDMCLDVSVIEVRTSNSDLDELPPLKFQLFESSNNIYILHNKRNWYPISKFLPYSISFFICMTTVCVFLGSRSFFCSLSSCQDLFWSFILICDSEQI